MWLESPGSKTIDGFERGLNMKTEKVHHTLPMANVTACGLECHPGVTLNGIGRWQAHSIGETQAFSFDLSKTTCEECKKRLNTPVTDAETARAVEDAGWLRTQGEDFHSLRMLVQAVNDMAESLDETKDGRWGCRGDRAAYVLACGDELHTLREADDADEDDACEYCGAEEADTRLVCTCPVCEQGRQPASPAGGLSHDHTNWLVRKVRGAITDLRAGQAWPDDARRVAAELEDRLDRILGPNDEPKSAAAVSCEPKRP